MKRNFHEAYRLLEQKLDIIQRLRMQIIDKKIDLGIEINKLKNTNKKLAKEITRHKQIEADLKQKLKHKKTT